MRFLLIMLVAYICKPSILISQIDQKIGEWRSFLPYNAGRSVTQSDDKIYYATGLSVLTIDKNNVDDWSFTSKVEGLSDIGAYLVKYDPYNDQLFILYDNSNIDILKDGDIYNIPDIKDNQNLSGSIKINDIMIFDDHTLFFTTDFGIVEFDTKKYEFGATIITNLAVQEMTSIDNTIYAATGDGIFYIDNLPMVNIADFSAWKEFGSEVGLPLGYEARHICNLDGRLFADIDDALYFRNEQGMFEKIDLDPFNDYTIRFLAPGLNRLIVGLMKNMKGKTAFIDEQNNVTFGGAGCTDLPLYAVEDQKGRIWYADEYTEIRYTDNDTEGCHKVISATPTSENASDLDVKKGVLYVSSGGVKENFTPEINGKGFYILKDGQWRIYNKWNIPVIKQYNLINNYQIAPHPTDDRIYVASYYEGLLEYNPEDESAVRYGPENSTLMGTVGDGDRERVSGLAFDDQKNLWINNYGAPKPLHALTPEGNWFAFDPAGNNQLYKVIVDHNGYIWSLLGGDAGGVVVFDPNGTVSDPTDDRSRLINAANSEMEQGKVRSIAVDLDGDVWVGTGKGPVIFRSGPHLFEDDHLGSRRKVIQDGIPALLLENEDIRAIGIDGANRKWFGTSSGVFVQSADGETMEMHFNEKNSPLFSDVIDAFAFDDKSGLMYISTSKGLQSYRTRTLGAKNTHASQVYAFPNPVRPDYQGDVAIKGLARDANVKITDLNGKLVYETTALGGQAIWNLHDYTGREVASGVYLVFSTGTASFDIPDTFVTKVMVVR